MMRAVIFDCFGVLTHDGWKQIREEFFSQDPEKLQHSLDIDKAVNAGFISYDDFISEIAHMSGLSESDVRQRLKGSSPNTQLFEYIRDELRPTYKIGMLSNMAANWLGDMFEPWQVALFDEAVLSYEIGAAKPDAIMYQTIANRLGIMPEEGLFVDDSERYTTAAQDIGMRAIWHQNTKDTITKINEAINA